MLGLTLNCEAWTPADLLAAVQEAARRIEAGSFTGGDRAPDGTKFLYQITFEEAHLDTCHNSYTS